MLAIDLPGLQILGGPYFGKRSGLFVTPGGLKGWDNLPSGRRDAVARPQAHGEFDLPVFRGPRLVTVEGVILASSGFDLGEQRGLLLGVGADGGPVQFTIEHQDQTLSATGRVMTASVTDKGKRLRNVHASFSIDLVCSDPRKYGQKHTVNGSTIGAFHFGNFPASPVLQVSGPQAAPYTINGPSGRKVTVTQALTSGQTHLINFATGTITRNGARQFGAISVYQPWTIPPGKTVNMSISEGSLLATTTDTYM